MAAIETEEGFTVVTLLGGIELEVEDEVSGNLDSLGRETFKHRTSGEVFEVFVERVGDGAESARAAMLPG